MNIKSKLNISIILLSIFLVACSSDKEAAKKIILKDLKDPGSAIFGEFTKYKSQSGLTFACFTVNSKNSMGGYSGNQEILLSLTDDEWEVGPSLEIGHSACVKTGINNR